MANEHAIVDRSGPVGIITLNRPKQLNAINTPMLEEMRAALEEFDQDETIRAVVMTGAGERAFSAGADIHEQKAWAEQELDRPEIWRDWTWYVATYRKPLIGALNGLVYGGAAQMAVTFDIRIGCERTSFRFLYAAVGRIVGTWVLPQIIGLPRAKEMLMTARVVEAAECERIGLVNQLVPADQLLPAAIALGEMIAKNYPESVQGIKALLHEHIGMSYQAMHDNEQESRKTRFLPPAVEESFKDFLSRKKPV